MDHFNSQDDIFKVVLSHQRVSGDSTSPNVSRCLAGVLLPETSHGRRSSCHATLLSRKTKWRWILVERVVFPFARRSLCVGVWSKQWLNYYSNRWSCNNCNYAVEHSPRIVNGVFTWLVYPGSRCHASRSKPLECIHRLVVRFEYNSSAASARQTSDHSYGRTPKIHAVTQNSKHGQHRKHTRVFPHSAFECGPY